MKSLLPQPGGFEGVRSANANRPAAIPLAAGNLACHRVEPPVLKQRLFRVLGPSVPAPARLDRGLGGNPEVPSGVLRLSPLLEEPHGASLGASVRLGAEYEAVEVKPALVVDGDTGASRARRARQGEHGACANQRERGQDLDSHSDPLPPRESSHQQSELIRSQRPRATAQTKPHPKRGFREG